MAESGADKCANRTHSAHRSSEFVGIWISVADLQIGDANSRSGTCHSADYRARKRALA